MARIEASKRTFVEELATNPQVNLMVTCERLGAPFNDGEAEISLAEKIAEKLYDRPELVARMLQQEAIEFLLQCWEMEGETLIAQMYLRELEQLHFLGFVSYEDDTILINMEAKDKFFFSLKSHRTQELMGEYTRLENILFGMLFLYGILDIYECYEIIRDQMIEDMTYDDLEEFVLYRIVFWQSGTLLRNQVNLRLLLASREVENRNEVFIQWNLHNDLPWKIYDEDQYKELALGNGIGNWEGIPELYDFVMQNMEDDQYKVMMIVKSLVVKIQNGLTYEEIAQAYISLLGEDDKEEQRTLCELIRTIYKTVPLYGLKGHTREELEEEENDHRFQVIRGGKE
jgi:hypothetical protein